MSNASYVCNDVLTMFEKTMRLPQGSDNIDVLAIYMCCGNGSEVTFKWSNLIQSLKESVSISEFFTCLNLAVPYITITQWNKLAGVVACYLVFAISNRKLRFERLLI